MKIQACEMKPLQGSPNWNTRVFGVTPEDENQHLIETMLRICFHMCLGELFPLLEAAVDKNCVENR